MSCNLARRQPVAVHMVQIGVMAEGEVVVAMVEAISDIGRTNIIVRHVASWQFCSVFSTNFMFFRNKWALLNGFMTLL